MARRLRRTVVAGGVTYPAGTAETSALAKAIPNPRAWDGESDPQPEETGDGEDDGEDEGQEPPRGGPGSGEDAWRAYATGLGIDVPEGADRGDIIALVDAHNTSK